jgi:hypothetical protein
MLLCEVTVILELNKQPYNVRSASVLSLLGEHGSILASESCDEGDVSASRFQASEN